MSDLAVCSVCEAAFESGDRFVEATYFWLIGAVTSTTRRHADCTPVYVGSSCEDCGATGPLRNGFCRPCFRVHLNHCSCEGRNDGDDCSLQPEWMGRVT